MMVEMDVGLLILLVVLYLTTIASEGVGVCVCFETS